MKIGKTLGLGLILLMAVPPAFRALDAGPRRIRQRRLRQRMLHQSGESTQGKRHSIMPRYIMGKGDA